MHILAGFFDINDNGLDATDVAVILGLLVTARLVFWGTWKVTRRKFADEVGRVVDTKLDEKLKVWTEPIQKYANDSYSLPDVAKESRRTTQLTLAIFEHLGIPVPPDPEPDTPGH